jgi:hypothetical protein
VGFVPRIVALVALRLLVALLVLCHKLFSVVVESYFLTQMTMYVCFSIPVEPIVVQFLGFVEVLEVNEVVICLFDFP